MNKTDKQIVEFCDQIGIDRIKMGALIHEKQLIKKVKRLQEENKRLQEDKDRVVSEREDLLSSCLYQDEIINKIKEHLNYIIGITDDDRVLAECNLILKETGEED